MAPFPESCLSRSPLKSWTIEPICKEYTNYLFILVTYSFKEIGYLRIETEYDVSFSVKLAFLKCYWTSSNRLKCFVLTSTRRKCTTCFFSQCQTFLYRGDFYFIVNLNIGVVEVVLKLLDEAYYWMFTVFQCRQWTSGGDLTFSDYLPTVLLNQLGFLLAILS